MSADIVRFVDALVSSPASNPHSVQLDLDTDDVQGVFEFLLMVMTEILKKWYPPPISVSNISPVDLVKLIEYFASFGYQFKLDVISVARAPMINNRDYLQQTELEDMKFQIASLDSKLYTVRFSILPTM